MESPGEDIFALRSDLLDQVNDLFLAVDVDTAEVVDANETLCGVTGYDRADLVGMAITDLTGFSDQAAWRDHLPGIDESIHIGENELVRADGERVPVEGSISRTSSNGTEYVVALLRDLTERKAQQRELSRFRAFVKHSSDVITVVDASGTVEYVSPASREVSGHDPDDLIGTNALESVHPDDRDRIMATLERLLADPGEIFTEEYRFQRADGSWFWVESTGANHLQDDDIQGIVLVSRDISERKAREQELRELTEEYEALLENADDAIFLVDVETTGEDVEFRFERLNPAHEAATGLSTEDVRGLTPREAIGEDLGAEVEANYRRCFEGREAITYEERLSFPEGERVWQTSLAPVIVDGEVTRIVGIARDITDQKEYERRLERQRDDLQVLNQVLRHDIRNDLQVILAYADILADKCDDTVQDGLDRIRDSAGHAADLTKTAGEMADVMLSAQDSSKAVELQPTLEAEIDKIRTAHPDVLITVDSTIPDLEVYADEMLSSVFRNLLKNAIQHNDKTIPKIEVSASRRDDSVVIHIADNGPGIPPERRDAVFGKGEKGLESDGAGIGLYLVRTLIENYGGDVWIENGEPEVQEQDLSQFDDVGGAVFSVELPIDE
jgi:PAS domain S-box-containing protein